MHNALHIFENSEPNDNTNSSFKRVCFDSWYCSFSWITSDTTFFIGEKNCALEFAIRMYVLEIKILKIVKYMGHLRIVKEFYMPFYYPEAQ